MNIYATHRQNFVLTSNINYKIYELEIINTENTLK